MLKFIVTLVGLFTPPVGWIVLALLYIGGFYK